MKRLIRDKEVCRERPRLSIKALVVIGFSVKILEVGKVARVKAHVPELVADGRDATRDIATCRSGA